MPDSGKNRVHGSDFGVGRPASVWLDEFGSFVWDAFGEPPYLVGSAIYGKTYRDVDVRLILDDAAYAAMGFRDHSEHHMDAKRRAIELAFCALGKQMTGLPIDFQIQQMTYANQDDGDRHALGLVPHRFRTPEDAAAAAARPTGEGR